MDINLEYYRVFYYVAKLGGITAAAETLAITQPAVSQAIRNLEKALGTELFIRTGKGVRLTQTGQTLYSYVRRGYEEIRAGERKLRKMMDAETGEICIGASDMTLRFYLLPILQRFHEAYPGIHLTVTNGPSPETMQYLWEGTIDFGFVTAPLSKKGGFHLTQVREIQDIFVAGSRFTHLRVKQLEWKRLEALPVVCLEKGTSTRSYVDAFLKEKGVSVQPEIELATSDMIVQFALKNLGVACVVRDFAEAYLESGELFELKFDQSIPRRAMYLAINKKIPISFASAKFLEMLEDGSTAPGKDPEAKSFDE